MRSAGWTCQGDSNGENDDDNRHEQAGNRSLQRTGRFMVVPRLANGTMHERCTAEAVSDAGLASRLIDLAFS